MAHPVRALLVSALRNVAGRRWTHSSGDHRVIQLLPLPQPHRTVAASGPPDPHRVHVVFVSRAPADEAKKGEKAIADVEGSMAVVLGSGRLSEALGAAVIDDLTKSLASAGACAMVYPSTSSAALPYRVLAVGTGAHAGAADGAAVRTAVASAVSALRSHKCTDAHFLVPSDGGGPGFAEALSNAVPLAAWRYTKHLTGDRVPTLLANATVELPIAPDPAQVAVLQRSLVVASATLMARDIVNDRGDVCTPSMLERHALGVAFDLGMKSVVLDVVALEAEGLALLAAVGRAATSPPRLVSIECDGLGGDQGTVVLVGKGVTFDTGGLNLKPTGSIEGMHMDMGGAAAVLGAARVVGMVRQAARAAGESAPLSRFSKAVFVLAIAENAIGPSALKPHEIIQAHNGLTVCIGNTDAEGRLCLADAMSWAQAVYKPTAVVDIATLTGACVVALGEHAAGLFANQAGTKLAAELEAAGAVHGEVLHRLPILPGHRKEIASHDHADVCSTGSTRWGGACTAAAFLERFVDDKTAWAHIDIAGPAMQSEERGVMPKGGTGFGVSTLAEFILGRPTA